MAFNGRSVTFVGHSFHGWSCHPRHLNSWMDGWMDGQTDGRTEGRIN